MSHVSPVSSTAGSEGRTLEDFIQTYGYAAVLLGTFLEGETVLLLAGFAAARGYLDLPGVVLAACLGSLAGDQLFFFLGRRHGAWLIQRHPSWRPRIARAQALIARYRRLIILGFRFLYGLRMVVPFALGMSGVPKVLFVLLDGVAAVSWSLGVSVAGYFFGTALEHLLGEMRHYEAWLFLGIIAAGGVVHLIRAVLRRSVRTKNRSAAG